MEATRHNTLTELPRDAMLRLRNGHDRTVVVFEGQVWVTQSGDLRDFVVGAGESLTLHGHGLAIVQGLCASRIMVLADDEPTPLSSAELQRQARAHRDAMLGEALSQGTRAAARAVVQALARRPEQPAPLRTAWATRA